MSETTPSRDTVTQTSGPSEDHQALRAQALKRLKDRRGLMAHALAYLSVNVLLVAIWVATGAGFFWPEPGGAQVDGEIERFRRQQR